MEHAAIRKDVVYRETGDGPLTLDVYSPADADAAARLPVVVLVTGYNDVGYERDAGPPLQGHGDVGLVGDN